MYVAYVLFICLKSYPFYISILFFTKATYQQTMVGVPAVIRVPQFDKTWPKEFQVQNPGNCAPFRLGLRRSVPMFVTRIIPTDDLTNESEVDFTKNGSHEIRTGMD
jgi:hypothetical protein